MKRIFTLALLVLTLVTYSQITPPIPTTGNANAVVVPTVVSQTTSHPNEIKLENTLTINNGVNFTINGNLSANNSIGKIILLGNNKLVITGNVNSSVYIEMNGDVCIYVNGTFNASSGYVTSSGINNFISASNINNISTISTSVCATVSASNPCGNTQTIACANYCSADQNDVATYNGNNWQTTITSTKRAIINGNFSGSSFNCCSLTVNQGKTLTINAGVVVTVTNNIANNGTIIIQDGGSLVQVNDAATNSGNAITVKRKTTAMKQYDYTYWSSPVKNFSLSNFNESYMYAFDGALNDWVSASGIMSTGKGYIVRAPENNLNTQIVETVFQGFPNTGSVSVPVAVGATTKANLIGNPYPSAVNADAFISNPTNSAILLNGMLYFWTHNKAISAQNPGNNAYNYSADDYAKYNLSGSVKTSPTGSGITPPNGYIASGQGFFIETKTGLSGTTKNLVFNNAMREKTANSNGQFYRATISTATVAPEETIIEKNRVWLNITNDDGAYDETLLGYITGATNDLDYGYDGPTFDGGNYVSIYSILGENHLSIQGRSVAFDQNEIIPLGFSSTIGGTLSIGIENTDGFFGNQDVFLVDKTNDIVTNLKEGSYTFNAEIGAFNDRFELKFFNAPLGIETPILDANTIAVVKNGNQLQLKSEEQNIASMAIYDLLGRLVYQNQNINTNTFSTGTLSVQNQMVVVKIITEANATVIKKVML